MAYGAWVEFLDRVKSEQALVSFPTDTVPAIAARPNASDRIYAAKQRPADKPLILMGADWGDLQPYLAGSEAELAQWQALAEAYWPGALTLVLPASDRVPPAMNPQQTGTLGIRVPDHTLARHILRHTGPLATTSANRSGQPALTTRAAIAEAFPAVLQLSDAAISDLQSAIGPFTLTASGVPSTVAAWQATGWRILRQGSVQLPADLLAS
ncbi:MAG: L-threonylcarbamoyladenylate synthase [Leptolyngbyaceae cyanobacterium T60_A2020_046]|nr:L-threonylcarbamoyladenylate synthase [Leptolyngbyaceae cyanobacterium T60_A2020_046]